MRSCLLIRLGMAALSMAAWVILVTWPGWSLAQDNPLRSRLVIEDEELGDAHGAIAEDSAAVQERRLAARIASICSHQLGPWMQWFTLAAQELESTPSTPSSPSDEEASDAIIEIPEAAKQALEDPPAEIPEDSRLVIGEVSEDPATPSPPPLPSSVSKAAPSRNVRTPKSLQEFESLDPEQGTPPRTLSESMKSKSEETSIRDVPAKRSIKSSDEDMREYLAQEEPTQESVRNSIHDQMQGVDADRAAKPDTRNEHEDGVARSPYKDRSTKDKPASNIPAAIKDRLVRVGACLEHYLKNPETTTGRSPWAVMHAILPYGADYELVGPNGRVNAIGWMCHNGLCRTQRIFTPRGDFFIPNVGGGVQGHEGQFLAVLAQSQVPLDYPIQIGSKKFTVEDLVRYEMATCKERSELTFKLIGLSYYVDANKQWRANDGKVWNLEKLLREELAQPVVGSACGGTHRLMGLSFCLRQREVQGLPINGQFARAAQFVNEYVRYTWQLQNPDGSFSTNWYAGRGNEPNDERKVQTSGHMLEWLMFTVSDEELTSPRVEKAVDFLLARIHDRHDLKWPIGPRGHATRALALYSLRIEALFEQRSGLPTDSVAQQRIQGENGSKTSISPAPVAPNRQPAGQPASRSTGRPSRRVRG